MRCRLAYCALAGAALAAFLAAASPAFAAILVLVDKSSQQMTVAVDGDKRFSWPVSTGKTGFATPSGAYTAFRMEEDHYSQEWDDAPMPHSIFFTKDGHAIHGSFETKRLGMPASHGCVRLSPAHASTLFALVRKVGLNNTKVVLTGSEQVALARRKVEVASRDKPKRERAQVARRNPNAGYAYQRGMPPAYAEAEEAYGRPRYLPQRYGAPGYAEPPYAPPGYGYGRRGDADGW
jgi:L,D-transpeptidase-like protein